jgi:hypothetical protein
MTPKWQYFYEDLTWPQPSFDERFNAHLNEQSAEGWELISASILEIANPRPWRSIAKPGIDVTQRERSGVPSRRPGLIARSVRGRP